MKNWTHVFLMLLCLSGCQATDYLTRDDCDADKDGDYAVGECGGHDCNDQNSLQSSLLAEVCNDKIDNNCDGQIDEGCQCAHELEQRPCYIDKNNKQFSITFPDGDESKSTCSAGSQECINGIWTACRLAKGPSSELCDGKDNDCNGIVDDDFHIGESCSVDVGACKLTDTIQCRSPQRADCGKPRLPLEDFITTQINGSWDNNCNGSTEKTCCDGGSCGPDRCPPTMPPNCGLNRYITVNPLIQECGSGIDVIVGSCECRVIDKFHRTECLLKTTLVGRITVGCK